MGVPDHSPICLEVEKVKIKRICEICSKVFYVYPYVIKEGKGYYCSRSCSAKSRIEKKNSHWNGGKIERICPVCNKSFWIPLNQIERGYGVYCSRSCARNVQNFWHMRGENNPNWRGGKVKRVCLICGKDFECCHSLAETANRGLYCSKSCAFKAKLHFTKPKKSLPECIFEDICIAHNIPFNFVGDGQLWIGTTPSLNPDFIHTNKKRKICVEVLGAWWHNSMINQKVSYERTYNGRKVLLKSYGWKMIGIWDHDLLRKDAEAFVLYTLEKHNIFPSTT